LDRVSISGDDVLSAVSSKVNEMRVSPVMSTELRGSSGEVDTGVNVPDTVLGMSRAGSAVMGAGQAPFCRGLGKAGSAEEMAGIGSEDLVLLPLLLSMGNVSRGMAGRRGGDRGAVRALSLPGEPPPSRAANSL
jgi:hypothetical protein